MNTIPLFKRDVLISIRPKYADKILSGNKTVELRRKFPIDATIGATAWIYSTSPTQAIIGHVTIVEVLRIPLYQIWAQYETQACIDRNEFDEYFTGLTHGYVIRLKGAKALQREIKGDELREERGFVAPQSFRYLDDEYSSFLNDERLQTSSRYKRNNRA